MTLARSVIDRIPDYIAKDTIRFTDTFQFQYVSESTPQTVYRLEKAPYERLEDVTAVVDGVEQTLSIGSEVEPRDTGGDGRYNAVAFISSSVYPDEGTEVEVRYDAKSVANRYTNSFSDDLDILGERLNEIQTRRYIETASGIHLDLIGSAYGEIARRRQRDDDEYRDFLASLTEALSGNGTRGDIKFVAASFFQRDPDGVSLIEDFEENEFSIIVDRPGGNFRPSGVRETLNLAAPTGVRLNRVTILNIKEIPFSGSSTLSSRDGLSTGIINEETLS